MQVPVFATISTLPIWNGAPWYFARAASRPSQSQTMGPGSPG